ncbi:MAG: hypothetical protein OXH81_09295 [Gemmatimonadetes bacterium]|nr:hypothetical protein [Gemmatimonadota bacterium]MDE2732960.1 hypothetical protein [Gemmatimonadota bacterium]
MGTLTAEEIKKAAIAFMLGAMAHQRASNWCRRNPDAKLPNIDFFLFPAVSFELILLSVEQSLRLLLLLHYSMVLPGTNHNAHALYKVLTQKSGGKEGIRQDITKETNMFIRSLGQDALSEKDLRSCLKKHDSSYTSIRYFQLNRHGRLGEDWEILIRDQKIFHCLGSALISLNEKEMVKQGIGVPTTKAVPESEMTEEQKAIKERLRKDAGGNSR